MGIRNNYSSNSSKENLQEQQISNYKHSNHINKV